MKGSDMDSVVVRGSDTKFQKTDYVEILKYPEKPTWITLRLFGPVFSDAGFWIASKRDQSAKRFYQHCRCYDPEQHQCVSGVYDPWYDEYQRERAENDKNDVQLIQFAQRFYMQAIVRRLQEHMPERNTLTSEEKTTHHKDINSDSYTPVVVVEMTPKVFRAIQALKEDNLVKMKSGTRRAFHVNDDRCGRDIMLKRDKSLSPGEQYQVKLVVDGGRTPLTDEEKSYLTWDMDLIYEPSKSDEEVKREFENWARRMGLISATSRSKSVEEEMEEDADDASFDSPKKSVKSKSYQNDDIEELDDEGFDDDDDSTSDEKPKKKSDDDFDEGFDDEEEKPTPKKASVKKSAPKKSDDDFDEGFDDEEEKPKDSAPKKSAPQKSDAKKSEDDDDDFDEDFDDDPVWDDDK